jgi:tetratricopeptide (TPR) repeat protein
LVKASLGVALLGMASSAHAEWRRFETAHFIIYSESSEEKATQFATRLESIDSLMHMATNLPDDVEPVKVRIYEVADEAAVQAAIGEPGSGIVGFYTSNSMGPYAVTLRRIVADVGYFPPELVLHHEYAHHFMLQYFPASYPLWYTEGFAELIGASKVETNGKVDYGFPAKYRGNSIVASWVPMRDVLLKPIDKLRGFNPYSQGWAITHFLTFNKERSQQLRQFLAALSSGRTPEEAAKAFGDLDQLDREVRAYVGRGSFEYRPVKPPLKEPVVQRMDPVPAAEAALIPETIAFSDATLDAYRKDSAREEERQRRAQVLERVREKVARFPNDPYALYVLAEVENAQGNAAASEAAVDRLLAIQPNNARGLARKSELLSDAAAKLSGPARAAKAAQARHLAVMANKADPNEPRALVAFYESFRAVGAPPSKDAIVGLEAAVATLPRDIGIRQMLVDQYSSERRWGDAIRTLGPIAGALDKSPLGVSIRQKMDWLKEQLAQQQGGAAASAKAN